MDSQFWAGLFIQTVLLVGGGVAAWYNLKTKVSVMCETIKNQGSREIECRKNVTGRLERHSTLIHESKERIVELETKVELLAPDAETG
jgi:hypothetical protein